MSGRERRRPRPRAGACAAAAVLLAALGAPGAAWAQWTSGAAPGGGGRTDAVARAADGAQLRIWVDEQRRLRAAFSLAPGLVGLDARGCPTFRIDDRPPEPLSRPAHECASDGASARLVLAQASQGQIASQTLLALMNGSTLTVRYRMAHAGYGESRFSLRGSKQALVNALDNLAVAGE